MGKLNDAVRRMVLSSLRLRLMSVNNRLIEASVYLTAKTCVGYLNNTISKYSICYRYNMQQTKVETPDWNDEDHKKCERYDEAVKAGTVTYRTIKIN